MTFRPESVRATVSCARISVILIYLLLAMAVVSSLMKTRNRKKTMKKLLTDLCHTRPGGGAAGGSASIRRLPITS